MYKQKQRIFFEENTWCKFMSEKNKLIYQQNTYTNNISTITPSFESVEEGQIRTSIFEINDVVERRLSDGDVR